MWRNMEKWALARAPFYDSTMLELAAAAQQLALARLATGDPLGT